jgi:transcriptional regulator of acetoin/glycerol metabolism
MQPRGVHPVYRSRRPVRRATGVRGHHGRQRAPDDAQRPVCAPRRTATPVALPLPVDELERRNLLAALAATGGNKTRAARLLGIDRVTLYNRLRKHGADTA